MKSKISWILALLCLSINFNIQNVQAQGTSCTDSAGQSIPCPPGSGEEGGGTGGGNNGVTFGFLGLNNNYFDPNNWNNSGLVPATGSNVLIDGKTAEIDPLDSPCGKTCIFGNVSLRNNARLMIFDTEVEFDTLDSDGSRIDAFNSYIKAKKFVDPGSGGILLNPSFLEADRIVLFKAETLIHFGIGGDQPAGQSGRGPGHYARMSGRAVDLDGQLDVFFLYGFHPQPGQTFEIVSVSGPNPINGNFANAPEGSVINGFCDVQLRLTYKGGDGNDVVLTAEPRVDTDPTCSSSFDEASSDKNIFLNGGVVNLQPTQPLEVQDINLINGVQWELHDGTFVARTIDSSDSSISLFNSHLKAETFIDPGFGGGGIYLNPSYLEAIRILLIHPTTRADFALGGSEPAGPTAFGKGYYARMQGDTVQLDGKLEIFLVYEFMPQPGQEFEIITVNRPAGLSGQFANAPQDSIVTGFCDVALRITYQGGDGNDVVLKAETAPNPDPNWECPSKASAASLVTPELTSSASIESSATAPASESTNEELPANTSSNNMIFMIVGIVVVTIALMVTLRRRS